MPFSALRAVALDLSLWAHGVDITVYPIDGGAAVTARGIWLTQRADMAPAGAAFGRREPHRVLAISRADVSEIRRGTRVVAPEASGGADRGWLVDAIAEIQVDHWRAVMVPEPE